MVTRDDVVALVQLLEQCFVDRVRERCAQVLEAFGVETLYAWLQDADYSEREALMTNLLFVQRESESWLHTVMVVATRFTAETWLQEYDDAAWRRSQAAGLYWREM